MAKLPARQDLLRVHKLVQLAAELRQGQSFEITRLTVLKSLCRAPGLAQCFLIDLAHRTVKRVQHGSSRSRHPDTATSRARHEMMVRAIAEMTAWQRRPSPGRQQTLRQLLRQVQDEQNDYEQQRWGPIRLVQDWDLLLVESALRGVLAPPSDVGYWVYHTARQNAERSAPGRAVGLVPASAPPVQDIADFFLSAFGLDASALDRALMPRKKTTTRQRRAVEPARSKRSWTFTHRQGQFLAFIDRYCQLHRQGPAEADLARYFGLTPPSVHGMIVLLEKRALITRQPGVGRSVRVAIPAAQIPELEPIAGPAW